MLELDTWYKITSIYLVNQVIMKSDEDDMGRCLRCGKDLSDPISLDLSFGPICRIAIKYEEYWHRSLDLFGSSDYTYDILGDILVIVDLSNGGASIASEIDVILSEISSEVGGLDSYSVICRDAQGVYDGICVRNNKFLGFYSINEKSLNEAVIEVKRILREGELVPSRDLTD